jgi:methylase of polypeptide subunit release factors
VSQRDSGYERKERDLYETPEWVTAALLDEGFRKPALVWEPACGSGKMLRMLELIDAEVIGTDIHETGMDFLTFLETKADAIITNPPYELAAEFIEHALNLTKQSEGQVMMLLRTDFDHAKTRANLFAECPAFAKKIVLTKRIRWFEDSKGSPSFNHAWFIWDWKHGGPPTLAYGP